MSHTNINNVGNDHSFWRKGLDFYIDEIDLMESRLAEIASKNTSFEARQGIEHFQNQFIVQRNNSDELNHDINIYVQKLGTDSQQHAGRVDSVLVEEHHLLQEKYEQYEKIMNGIRHEFKNYLAKWM
jgi:uncharacterized membrane protein